MKRWLIPVLIVATVSLVAFPVWIGGFGELKIKWSLARVANLVETDIQAAEIELENVARQMPAPQLDRDYWIIKQRIAFARNDNQQAVQVARSALAAIPDFTVIIEEAYNQSLLQGDYQSALQALIVLYSRFDNSQLHPDDLNRLAYTRALAVIDLDSALLEINQALKYDPDSAAYLDTRAWIFFQMGRLIEALEDADRAVQIADRWSQAKEQEYSERLFYWFNGKSTPSSPDGTFTQTEARPHIWGLGAIRYHRARILEALGRTEEAEKDWQWLQEQQLPKDDRLR